jgi:hypothetical protein
LHTANAANYFVNRFTLGFANMDYGLARLVLGASKFVSMTEEEYFDIRRRREILLEALFIEEKFDLVVDNYLEFETDLLDSVAREMVRGVQSWTAFQAERNQMNRRIVNLLSACRLYLDHTRHHLGNIDSNNGEIAKTIEAKISAQYDGSLGYRTMEALRNYVQHRGYPLHGVTFDARWLDDWKKARYAVTPYMKIAELAEDGKFKAAVLEELKARGDTADIKPIVREYVDGLGKIHTEVRTQIRSLVEESDTVIRGAIERYRKADPIEDSVIGLAAVRREERAFTDSIQLFEELLDYRKGFERKNRNLNNLAKRYVTSEAITP